MKHKMRHIIKGNNNSGKYKVVIITFIVISFIILVGSLIFSQEQVRTKGKEINDDNHYEEVVTEVEENSEDEAEREALEKSQQQIEEINAKVHEILGENERYYGIYYCDLNTESQYSLNGDKEFHAASTIKVPIAMMVADKLYNKEITENTLIEYTSEDDSDGAGILQGEVSEGDKITVSELMKDMIEESDNIATAMLKRNIGNVSDYIGNLTSIKADNENNFITPKQSCLILQELYDKSSENLYYNKIIQYMKETSTHDRLDKYIPNNIVAHKIGDYDKYVNDMGIVYTKEPYILVAYTKDVMEEGRENIAQISKAIYEIKTDN